MMHVLFVHQNFPAQLGSLAIELRRRYGWRCTYLTKWKGATDALPILRFEDEGNTTEEVAFSARNFDRCARAAAGAWRAVRAAGLRDVDLVVGHSGFGSTLLLGDALGCPVVNLFEYYYRPEAIENPFRPEFPPEPEYIRRIRVLNAMILLDLQQAAAGYTPTHFQRNQFPACWLPKIETLFDGIDTRRFRRLHALPRVICGRTIPDEVKIVTYVSRGFEAMRGFDIFIRVAKRVYREYPKVLFVVVGTDRVCYGGDLRYIEEKSFRAHVEKVERPDPAHFFYTGLVPHSELVRILSLSDAHVYFTAPFVLSWSLFNAMACGARIVSCRTAPVEEVVTHGESALLADFGDVEGHARHLLAILRDGPGHAFLGTNARRTVERRYSLDRSLPRLALLFQRAAGRKADAIETVIPGRPALEAREA